MITQMELSLLIRLIIAHLLSDFVFQSDSWVNQRFKFGWHSKHLYIHGIIAGSLAYFASGLWGNIWILIFVAITHILIDGVKIKSKDNIRSFLIDQLAHFVIFLFIWIVIINPGREKMDAFVQILLPGIKIWTIIAAYLIILWPSSKFISKLTEKWRVDSENICPKDESLDTAGRWIGWLERFLILTFVLLQQFGAIGLLVAAKSIFRFNESRKVGEYVLIGTLLSFAIAILVGLFASFFLYRFL
ncbi:MAG: DUF3307 domain-containing protein [Candidatus Methanoperedens sp.]|nr:DUF3307 domain-containing protein [Candidatus Methanoperedens sp.]